MNERKYNKEEASLMSFIFLMQYLAICNSAGPSTRLNSRMPSSVMPWTEIVNATVNKLQYSSGILQGNASELLSLQRCVRLTLSHWRHGGCVL